MSDEVTDLQRWRDFLESFGIEFTEPTERCTYAGPDGSTYEPIGYPVIRLSAKSRKVEGYRDFFVDVTFTTNGIFETIGIWE